MMEDDSIVVVYYGGAKPDDKNFATIRAVDEDIFEVLEKREAKRRINDLICKRFPKVQVE
jgi:hypothetical protein